MMLIQIVGGIDAQLIFAIAAQHDADGVNVEVVVDLFGDFANQLVNVQTREHRIGDGDQDAEIVTLTTQQIVVDVVADPVLDLFGHDADDLGEGL